MSGINDQIYATHNCYGCGSEHDGPDNNCAECEHAICCANATDDNEELPMNPDRRHLDADDARDILDHFQAAHYTITIAHEKHAQQPYSFTLRSGDDVLRTDDDTLPGAVAVARQSLNEMYRQDLITDDERAEHINRVITLTNRH